MNMLHAYVPELSRTDFVETYGRHYRSSEADCSAKIIINEEDNEISSYEELDKHSIAGSRTSNLKKCPAHLSNDTLASSNETLETISSNNTKMIPTNSTNTSGYDSTTTESLSKDEKALKWLANVTPRIRRSMRTSIRKRKAYKEQIIQLSAFQLLSASHSGYLDRRNKKKQWERFWCVFQDSCLYCYISPQSDVTRDIIVIRGYEVVADVTNLKRDRFTFHLEQQKSPTFHFRTDNHEDFLLWVGCLEKEARNIPSYDSVIDTEPSESACLPPPNGRPKPVKLVRLKDSSSSLAKKKVSHKLSDQELAQKQKYKLLEEIAIQQQHLLQEQKILDKELVDDVISSPVSAFPQFDGTSKRLRVIEKFERVLYEEENKAVKAMAFLNRRRNSVQLKVDQYVKDIAPKSGKNRRHDHKQFAAIEVKLFQLKEKLQEIDNEIHQLQENKQKTLDKIREREALELLITDQQVRMTAILRQIEDNRTLQQRSGISTSREDLEAIDDLFNISRCSDDESANNEEQKLCSLLEPILEESDSCTAIDASLIGESSSDGTTLCQVDKNQETYPNSASILTSPPSSCLQLQKSPPPIKQPNKEVHEVDASIMAGIEAFEEFSKQFLKKCIGKQ